MLKKSGIAMLVAGALFAAHAGAHDMTQSSATNDWASSEQLTVFDPDGSSYMITPVEIEVASVDPAVFMAALDDNPPQQLTVFDPDGMVYSYEFVPSDSIAMSDSTDDWYASNDPMGNDVTLSPVAFDDEPTYSTYEAYYVSPPTYTGILEDDSAL